jgi:nicotinamide mononucleotide transporter
MSGLTDFLAAFRQVSPFEAVAAALGIASVYCSTRQNILAWPTSLINNAMYGVFFFQQKLYALMALQAFFGAIAVYGWYQWLFGGEQKTELRVSRTPPALGMALAGLGVVATGALVWLLRQTADPEPLVDGSLTAVSLIAQWMMARKLVECWPVWVGVNLVSVPFFFHQANYPTAVQYAVFLLLAMSGWRQWRRSLAAVPAPA